MTQLQGAIGIHGLFIKLFCLVLNVCFPSNLSDLRVMATHQMADYGGEPLALFKNATLGDFRRLAILGYFRTMRGERMDACSLNTRMSRA